MAMTYTPQVSCELKPPHRANGRGHGRTRMRSCDMAQGTCSVDGCASRIIARGLCHNHYEQARYRGELTQHPRVRTGRKVNGKGYVQVWEPTHPLAAKDGYVFEHRKVVYDAGVDIPLGHQVHHINGVRDDNRLENLEVKDEAEHHRDHMREAGVSSNQFGTFPIIRDAADRRRRNAELAAKYRARDKARRR